MRLPDGSWTSWTRRWRIVAACAVLGAVLGALLASAGPPHHESEASVVVAADRLAEDPIEMRRLAELASASQVAEGAAVLLGGDLPGADVLTQVTVRPAADGGALLITATADSPDFAPAVADAYALATVEALGGSLEVAADASDAVPIGGRSIILWSLIGLLAGLALGIAAAIAIVAGLIRIEPAILRSRSASAGDDDRPVPARPAEAFPGAAEIVDFDPSGAVRLSLPAKGVVTDLIDGIGLEEGGRRSLAVLASEAEDSSGAAAVAIAVAAASRGQHVLIIDARLTEPSVADLLRVPPEPGLAEYLSGTAGPRRVLRRVPAVDQDRQPCQLACLPAGLGDAGAGVAGARFTELLERVLRVYDLVVIAGPPLASEAQEAGGLAAMADRAIVVCGADPARRATAREAAENLQGATLQRIVDMERP